MFVISVHIYIYIYIQWRRNELRSGTARTGVWGYDPQGGSKGQSPWSGGEAPWKLAFKKKLNPNLNLNLYSKLIWDYYKMDCDGLVLWITRVRTRATSTFHNSFFFFPSSYSSQHSICPGLVVVIG